MSASRSAPRAVGVIPARYGSTRFPGKPLVPIAGKPLLQWVIEGALTAKKLSQIVVATDDAVAKNSFYGLAIGFTIVVAAFAGGSVSGGAFNPAVGLGAAAAALDGAALGHAWLYLVGPVSGALLATLVYHLQHPSEAV